MEKNNNIKIMINQQTNNPINDISQNISSIYKLSQNPKINFKSDKNENLEKSISLLKLISNKAYLTAPMNFKIIPEIQKKGKTCSFTLKNNIFSLKNKKSNYNISSKTNSFYLISSINKTKKKKFKNYNSSKDLDGYKRDNMIDLIHNKEIKVCLDLIKSFPENGRNKQRRLNLNKDFKSEVTNGLVKSIKFFNIDNINNQRILENQIIKNSDYIPRSLSEYNTLKNATLLSISTNYKTKNSPLNDKTKFNNSNYNDLNNTSISMKNNSNLLKYINDNKIYNLNNSEENKNFLKKQISKIINHNNNLQKKFDEYKKNEINFVTGFVRSQKNINGDVFTKYLNNKEKFEINIQNYKKKKEESNKLSLPEIQEYKSIINEVKNRKNKILRKSQSVFDSSNKEKIKLNIKDKLIDELNELYLNQKTMFLSYLKNNICNRRIFAESYKKEVNENIDNINKRKREQNFYIDGYSLLNENINKKLQQFNKILGNKFHDKEQKMEKVNKFCKICNEYENKIKNYENEIFKETNLYNQLFSPKFEFNRDKKNNNKNNFEIDLSKHNINKSNENISLDSSITFKIDNNRVLSKKSNKEEKIYKHYSKKYSFD